MAVVARLGGRAVLTAPSTFTHLAVDPGTGDLRPNPGPPPAFVVHRFAGDQLVSYVQPA